MFDPALWPVDSLTFSLVQLSLKREEKRKKEKQEKKRRRKEGKKERQIKATMILRMQSNGKEKDADARGKRGEMEGKRGGERNEMRNKGRNGREKEG